MINDSIIVKIKNEILGKPYKLSFVFAGKNKIKTLNNKYRCKNEPTDVLSFPISEKMGEIFVCKEVAKKKSKKFSDPISNSAMTFENYLIFLVIHGCLHLKGLKHGDKMERYEFSYYSRYRCGHV